MSEVTPHDVQTFLDAYNSDGKEPATLQLERAVIRRVFNYARTIWRWAEPATNPAVELTLPSVDNARDRVMSTVEQERLDAALEECHNKLVGPTLTLLTESAMRSSEPIEHACWSDVDWEKKILKLRDSKNDKRDVPLSPKALEALHELRRLNPGGHDEAIVRISYESLKAAWTRVCERAGVNGLRLQDLRHTAATRPRRAVIANYCAATCAECVTGGSGRH
jgi:integrase